MKKDVKKFFMNNHGVKVKTKELAKKLNIRDLEEYASLKQLLFKLSEEGFLDKVGKRYSYSPDKVSDIVGTFQLTKEGTYGFVVHNHANLNDIFIPEKHFNTAFDGDKVEVSLLAKKRGKNIEGQINKIVRRKRKEIIGTLKKSQSFYFVVPDDEKIHRDIYIHTNNISTAKHGDKVIIADLVWENPKLNPEGKVVEVLGKSGSYDVEIQSIAHEFDLPTRFPREIAAELEDVSEKIPEDEIAKRLDFREEIVFTIDPDDAKDFDDAVSIKVNEKGNFEVGIHIADVSHYIKKDSVLYREALERGNSVYLVGRVIPMLPEKLSNKICSLVPYEDRLTFSVIAELSKEFKLLNYSIRKAVINSKRRFTYDEVQEILDNKEGEFYKEIGLLNRIALALKKQRIRKGSINFIRPEVKFELDETGKPINVVIKEIKQSNNLIEELMLLANQIVAKHVNILANENNREYPFVYRVHDKPDNEKINEFARFVRSLGYHFDTKAVNKSKEMQRLLDFIKGAAEEPLVNEIAIRSMAKAVYTTFNIGHYGLGFEYYSHFTSPIRRFPDLIVHKLLMNYLDEKVYDSFSFNELNEICDHTSERERVAVSAERVSTKLKQIEFLRDKLGHEFQGVISGITNFGIFVELSENLAEGLVKLRDMDDDYYEYDEKNYSLIGRISKKRYRLGDRVLVKVIRVDEERREIDFLLMED